MVNSRKEEIIRVRVAEESLFFVPGIPVEVNGSPHRFAGLYLKNLAPHETLAAIHIMRIDLADKIHAIKLKSSRDVCAIIH